MNTCESSGMPPLSCSCLNLPSSPPTQWAGKTPIHPRVEASLLKKDTRTCPWKYRRYTRLALMAHPLWTPLPTLRGLGSETHLNTPPPPHPPSVQQMARTCPSIHTKAGPAGPSMPSKVACPSIDATKSVGCGQPHFQPQTPWGQPAPPQIPNLCGCVPLRNSEQRCIVYSNVTSANSGWRLHVLTSKCSLMDRGHCPTPQVSCAMGCRWAQGGP